MKGRALDKIIFGKNFPMTVYWLDGSDHAWGYELHGMDGNGSIHAVCLTIGMPVDITQQEQSQTVWFDYDPVSTVKPIPPLKFKGNLLERPRHRFEQLWNGAPFKVWLEDTEVPESQRNLKLVEVIGPAIATNAMFLYVEVGTHKKEQWLAPADTVRLVRVEGTCEKCCVETERVQLFTSVEEVCSLCGWKNSAA